MVVKWPSVSKARWATGVLGQAASSVPPRGCNTGTSFDGLVRIRNTRDLPPLLSIHNDHTSSENGVFVLSMRWSPSWDVDVLMSDYSSLTCTV